MSESHRCQSICSIRRLCQFASVFGITPLMDHEKPECRRALISVAYGSLWCCIEIALTACDLCGRIGNSYKEMNVPTIAMDVLSLIVQTVTIVCLTIKLTACKRATYERFVVELHRFDEGCDAAKRPRRSFYAQLTLYHVAFALFCASDAYMWNRRLGFRVLRAYLSRYLQYYKIVTFAFLFYNYVRIVGDRFAYLNATLIESVTLANRLYLMHDCAAQEEIARCGQEYGVRKLNGLFTATYCVVNAFNDIFGTVVLLMCVTIVTGLLQPINIAFSYAKTDLSSPRQTMDPDLIVVCVLWAILFLMCAVMIVAPCDAATKESQKTSYIAHKLINELPVCNKQINMREDLALLAQHAYQHSAKFSADGFFNIDHSLLSSILASVTSYLIVLIQLN